MTDGKVSTDNHGRKTLRTRNRPITWHYEKYQNHYPQFLTQNKDRMIPLQYLTPTTYFERISKL